MCHHVDKQRDKVPFWQKLTQRFHTSNPSIGDSFVHTQLRTTPNCQIKQVSTCQTLLMLNKALICRKLISCGTSLFSLIKLASDRNVGTIVKQRCPSLTEDFARNIASSEKQHLISKKTLIKIQTKWIRTVRV